MGLFKPAWMRKKREAGGDAISSAARPLVITYGYPGIPAGGDTKPSETRPIDYQISKDADYVMCCMYRIFLQRQSVGMGYNASRTMSMGESNEISFGRERAEGVCKELHRKGHIDCSFDNNNALNIKMTMTESAIEYMSRRFPLGLDQLVSFLSKNFE